MSGSNMNKPIDEMAGLTDKGKGLLKELRLERLVDEPYLRTLYEKHKKFFDDPKSWPVPMIKGILIGKEVLEDLDKLEHDVKEGLGNYYKEEISPRANAMVASQGVFLYIFYQLAEVGLITKPS